MHPSGCKRNIQETLAASKKTEQVIFLAKDNTPAAIVVYTEFEEVWESKPSSCIPSLQTKIF